MGANFTHLSYRSRIGEGKVGIPEPGIDTVNALHNLKKITSGTRPDATFFPLSFQERTRLKVSPEAE